MLNPDNWKIVQYFGKTAFALSPEGRKLYVNFKDIWGRPIGHPGYDFTGDRIIPAYTKGKVIQAGWNGNWGLSVTVYDGTRWYRLYAHLREVYVQMGNYVRIGQKVGFMGNTPSIIGYYKMGVHLHYSKYYKVFWKKIYVDPKDDFNIINKTTMVIENLVRQQKQRLNNLLDGKVVLTRDTNNGKIYSVRIMIKQLS